MGRRLQGACITIGFAYIYQTGAGSIILAL